MPVNPWQGYLLLTILFPNGSELCFYSQYSYSPNILVGRRNTRSKALNSEFFCNYSIFCLLFVYASLFSLNLRRNSIFKNFPLREVNFGKSFTKQLSFRDLRSSFF